MAYYVLPICDDHKPYPCKVSCDIHNSCASLLEIVKSTYNLLAISNFYLWHSLEHPAAASYIIS